MKESVDYYPSPYTLFLLSAVLLTIYLYCCFKLNYWKRKGVPQLKNTNKLFGNVKNGILFRTAPGYHFGEFYREIPNVPYIGLYVFHKPCLLIRDVELVKQILVRDFENFTDRHFAGSQQKDSIGMKNLFGIKNPTWRYIRKKITPTLNRRKLQQMFLMMMETGKPMMDYIRSNVDDEGTKVIDVQDINYKYTADLIANFGFGTKTDSFHYPHSDYTKSLMNIFSGFSRMVALLTVALMPELVKITRSRIFPDTSLLHKIFTRSIEDREKSGGHRGDYIDSMIELKNGEQNPIYKFEGDNLVHQSATLFGFETSSIASSFTLMELAKHKQCQRLAREEIKQAIGRNGWTFKAFNEMTYLDRCIAESVRLHPSAPVIDRYTLQDYEIPNTDLVIEKGTPIFISLYGLHYDPQYFDKPELFDPERFNPDGTISDAFLGFGIGPRMCAGVKAGQLHVKIVISMILLEYEMYQNPTELTKLYSRCALSVADHGINIEFTKLDERTAL